MTQEEIIRRRMHGLYLSRPCWDLESLSHELLGLHCWFYRNVPFSALIRGAGIFGIKTALTKTWLYRGTLHGVQHGDLPELLALHADSGESYLNTRYGQGFIENFAAEVLRYMEDGVYSRTEFRQIFAGQYDAETLDMMFSPWGGVFVYLARRGLVAFRDMTSRDFDMISAEPTKTADEVLPELFHRYITAYGPATLNDAAWFFGFWRDEAKKLRALPLDKYESFKHDGKTYYYLETGEDTDDIPELTLLSGFDPLLASYTSDDRIGLKQEHKSRVILKSGICLPTIAINGEIAGLWNIKKKDPVVEFFAKQPKRLENQAMEKVEAIIKAM